MAQTALDRFVDGLLAEESPAPDTLPKSKPAALVPGEQPLGEPSLYRALYQQATQAIPEDFPTVDAWLVDVHPRLWEQLRKLDDELLKMEQEGVAEATYREKLAELVDVCQQAKDLKDGTWQALLVKAALLDCEVWVIRDEQALALVKDDNRPVFFADEIALLKGKNPEQLGDILKTKEIFPGCRVVQ